MPYSCYVVRGEIWEKPHEPILPSEVRRLKYWDSSLRIEEPPIPRKINPRRLTFQQPLKIWWLNPVNEEEVLFECSHGRIRFDYSLANVHKAQEIAKKLGGKVVGQDGETYH